MGIIYIWLVRAKSIELELSFDEEMYWAAVLTFGAGELQLNLDSQIYGIFSQKNKDARIHKFVTS